jgi:serine/threonine protein kinase
MEYICGDLLTFIRKRNKLNEPISKVIFKQIIEGLRYIHKKNIIHRDIKLDNILIDTTNTVKICDFGVSRRIQRGEKIYERCGTPAYIAPEIYKKVGYTGFQSDVWSAGVTLYYMLSGNLPFKGNNIHDLENAILLGEYHKIRDISYEANDIIEKMLKLNPSERITIDEILKHPWLKNVNLTNRHKLNIFTKAEKKVLSKYYIDYLNSAKSDLLENFTYRNLTIDNSKKRLGGNTKSVIYAPYNTCVNENENFSKNTKKNDMSYLSKEELKLYKELKIENEVCKFGWRVRQANINYELSNNDDYDNGLIKSLNDDEINHLKKNEDNYFSDSISIESVKDYEKIQINGNILKFIETKIGYDQKYLIKCLKKNIINYATAAYYLKFKEDTNKNDKDNNIFINN